MLLQTRLTGFGLAALFLTGTVVTAAPHGNALDDQTLTAQLAPLGLTPRTLSSLTAASLRSRAALGAGTYHLCNLDGYNLTQISAQPSPGQGWIDAMVASARTNVLGQNTQYQTHLVASTKYWPSCAQLANTADIATCATCQKTPLEALAGVLAACAAISAAWLWAGTAGVAAAAAACVAMGLVSWYNLMWDCVCGTEKVDTCGTWGVGSATPSYPLISTSGFHWSLQDDLGNPAPLIFASGAVAAISDGTSVLVDVPPCRFLQTAVCTKGVVDFASRPAADSYVWAAAAGQEVMC